MASVVQTDDHLYEDEMASALPVSHKTNKSWSELRQAVRKTRRLASTLLNRVPNTFTFRSISSSNGREVRLYYLGVPQGMRENTLLYVDVPLNENLDGIIPQLEWKLLLEAFHATPLHGKFSKEELLLRERKRVGSFGITSYDYHEASGKFVFPACNGLYMCCDRLVDRRFVVSILHSRSTHCFRCHKNTLENIHTSMYVVCVHACACACVIKLKEILDKMYEMPWHSCYSPNI